MPIDSLLAGWPVVIEQAVCWGEMDAFQHVNNVPYFRYLENVRIAYMAKLGWPDIERQTGVGIILASVQAKFRRPLTWPDTIAVTARAVNLQTDRFTLQHQVISRAQEAVATEAEGVVVTFDYTRNMKAPIPEELRRRIAAIEGTIL